MSRLRRIHLGYWAKPTSFLGKQQDSHGLLGSVYQFPGRIDNDPPGLLGKAYQFPGHPTNNCDETVTGTIKSQSTMVKTIHSLPFTTYYISANLLFGVPIQFWIHSTFQSSIYSYKCNCPNSMGELLPNQMCRHG